MLGVRVGVVVGVGVMVSVGIGVAVVVHVGVMLDVRVGVAVGVGVMVSVGMGVSVGSWCAGCAALGEESPLTALAVSPNPSAAANTAHAAAIASIATGFFMANAFLS